MFRLDEQSEAVAHAAQAKLAAASPVAKTPVVERRSPNRATNVHRAWSPAPKDAAPLVSGQQAQALPRTGTDDWTSF